MATKIYRYWEECSTEKEGYSTADIEYAFDCIDYNVTPNVDVYGNRRKSLKAAINDAKKAFKKYPKAYFGIYAYAELKDIYDDGTVKSESSDVLRVGTLDEAGEYMDMLESAAWLD